MTPIDVGLVVALGAAGVDPLSALVALAASATGARARVVAAFTGAAALGTVVAGVLLGAVAHAVLPWVTGQVDDSGAARVAGQLVAAGALSWWAVRRRRDGAAEPELPAVVSGLLTGTGGMSLAGAVLGLAAPTDPTFLGVALVMSDDGAAASALAALVWFAVSQLPLLLVMAALLAWPDPDTAARVGQPARRFAVRAGRLAAALAVPAAAALVLNAVGYLVTGEFRPV